MPPPFSDKNGHRVACGPAVPDGDHPSSFAHRLPPSPPCSGSTQCPYLLRIWGPRSLPSAELGTRLSRKHPHGRWGCPDHSEGQGQDPSGRNPGSPELRRALEGPNPVLTRGKAGPVQRSPPASPPFRDPAQGPTPSYTGRLPLFLLQPWAQPVTPIPQKRVQR